MLSLRAAERASSMTASPAKPELDAVIVGAGFADMYMLHCLRELGFSARVFEVGSDVGGTWYWNRYPGARCDIESLQYSYPVIAAQAAALTVFQRTPNYAVPAWNAPLDPERVRAIKADYPGFRAKARSRPTGFYFPYNTRPALDSTPQERRRQYEECWGRGGLPFLGAFGDLLLDKAANDTAAEFARGKIRAVVEDPATAELLCPDNVFGCKRLCVDTGYYETYNLDHVTLVDVSERPIERFTAGGVVAHGAEYPADTAIFATGF